MVVFSVYLMLNSNYILFSFFLYIYLREQRTQVGHWFESKRVLVRCIRASTCFNHRSLLALPIDLGLTKKTALIARQTLWCAWLCTVINRGASLAAGPVFEKLLFEP